MVPISVFIDACRELDERAFVKQHPHPVLLHVEVSGSLAPASDSNESTMERMLAGTSTEESAPSNSATVNKVDIDSSPDGSGQPYSVFVLAPKHEWAKTISIGCSGQCCLQINDRSISNFHAYFEAKGGLYFLWDNESSTGTKIDDVALEAGERREIHAGDRVSLGFVDLTFLPAKEFYQFVRRLYFD